MIGFLDGPITTPISIGSSCRIQPMGWTHLSIQLCHNGKIIRFIKKITQVVLPTNKMMSLIQVCEPTYKSA